MKIKTDEHKIVLTDLPLTAWLFGLVFAIVGLQLLIPSLLSGNILGILIGVLFAFGGSQTGLLKPYERITIDRWLKTITVRKIGLLNFGKTEYAAGDIEKIYSETETDSEDAKSYTICLSLTGGQSLVIGGPFQSKAECETVIKTAETFFRQQTFPDRYQPKYL